MSVRLCECALLEAGVCLCVYLSVGWQGCGSVCGNLLCVCAHVYVCVWVSGQNLFGLG